MQLCGCVQSDWTPLLVAVSSGHAEVAALLIGKRADVEANGKVRWWSKQNKNAVDDHVSDWCIAYGGDIFYCKYRSASLCNSYKQLFFYLFNLCKPVWFRLVWGSVLVCWYARCDCHTSCFLTHLVLSHILFFQTSCFVTHLVLSHIVFRTANKSRLVSFLAHAQLHPQDSPTQNKNTQM